MGGITSTKSHKALWGGFVNMSMYDIPAHEREEPA
jgi:hypothetical protein